MLFDDLAYKIYNTNDYGHSILWVPKLLLGSILMWPDTKYRFLCTLSCFITLFSCIFTTFGLIGYMHDNIHDFNKASLAMTFMMIPFTALAKCPIVWYRLKEIKRLINEIREDFWPYDLVDVETKATVEKIYMYSVIFTFYFFSLCQAYSIAFVLIPLFTSQKDLPFPCILPIPCYKSPYYEIIYILHFITMVLSALVGATGTDFMVLGICEGAANQYRILQKCFQAFNTNEMFEINEKLRKNTKDFENNYTIEKEYFIRCVRQHVFLLRFTNELNEALSPLALGNLIICLFGICMGIFVSSRPETTTMILILTLIYTAGFLFQLAIDCGIGTDLYYQATLVPDCIFKSNWVAIENNDLKKDIVFVIQQSQRYPIFSAYGLYNMNMESYAKVVKMAFSMYTLLTKMSKNDLLDQQKH